MEVTLSPLSMWTLALTLIFTTSFGVMTYQDKGEVLDTISNLFVTGGGSKTRTIQTDSFAKCVVECYVKSSCSSVSYNKNDSTCYINTINVSNLNIFVEYDERFVYTEIYGRRQYWHLVFRATSEIGTSVYDAWNNVGHHDDVTSVTADNYGCLTLDGRLPCDKHFRSWRLDEWKNVERVRYGFYATARNSFRVVFRYISDLDNATYVFNNGNVAESYGNNLDTYNGTFGYSSVEGYPECHRRFYINQELGGDCQDYGWMMINDGNGGSNCCSYETTGPYPQFLVSGTGDAVNWNNETAVERADVFAVLVRYI